MSLYNLIHGVNPMTPLLLAILDIDQPNGRWGSGRFRDIYFDKSGDHIILYTRNGGGNREDFFPDDICDHPQYVTDWDDDFDCTYAYIRFRVPEQYRDIGKHLSTGENPLTVGERFAKTIEEMQTMTPEEVKGDARFSPLVELLGKLVADPGPTQKEG